MKVMKAGEDPMDAPAGDEATKESGADTAATVEVPEDDGKKNEFSDENLMKDVEVDSQAQKQFDLGKYNRRVVITPTDKINFLDSVVGNTRYTRSYSIFGGKITLTIRSLTVDETNALAAWAARIGTRDPAGLVAGRYRKYLVAAQIAMYNGAEMPPLEEPLFETLGKDGKTLTDPGWLERCKFWDGLNIGVFNAIMQCIADFDLVYSTLCSKAEDTNFWNPDTP